MYIKSFGINLDKSKRLWAVIFTALLVAATLIVISFIFVFNKSSNSAILKIEELYFAKSYYAEYDLKVYSNKNENNYKIKEWYIKDSDDYKFRIETNNDENNFIYLGNKNSIYIKSEQQISSFDLQNYNSKRNNFLSISSVVEILYNLELLCKKCDVIDKQCCKIKEIEIDTYQKYILEFCKDYSKCNNCKICNKFIDSKLNISKIEVIVDKPKNIPKQYIIYDNDEKIYIDIVYRNFCVNVDFDEKIFAI